MEEESIRSALASATHLHAPMGLFEAPYSDGGEAMHSIIAKCEALCASDEDRAKLFKWLNAISGQRHLVFYGGAVYGAHRTTDVDVLSLDPRPALPYYSSLNFIHIHKLPEGEDGAKTAGLFLANTLLFPCTPDAETVARIEAARKQLSVSPFFDGGIGELITHAAFKSVCVSCSKPLTVHWRWTDETNMLTKTYTPHQINDQIRNQMQDLDDKDVHGLAMAAMRRIRIREDRRAGLADRFVKELRQEKIHRASG